MESERLHWVDVAKAVAVVLVVLYHVATTGMTMLTPGTNRAEDVYSAASSWLLPVRMPLFFLVSGLLSVGATARPWRVVLQPRVADHLWVFALWTLLFAVPYAAAYNPANFAATTGRAFSWVVSLNGAYWYLPMLVLFFVVAKLGRRIAPVVLALAVLGYLFSGQVPGVDGTVAQDLALTLRRFLSYFVWFALGAFAKPLVVRWAKVPGWLLPVLGVAYVGLALVLYGPEPASYQRELTAALSLIGITFFLGASRIVSGSLRVRRLGAYLAARTLPIYLFHPLILALIVWLAPGFGVQGSVVSIWLVPLVVAVLTGAACLIYDRTHRAVPWLYRSPRVAAARPARAVPVG